MNLKYLFFSGKNSKFLYYLRNYPKLLLPKRIFQLRLKGKLKQIEKREDSDYIKSRIDYYNKLRQPRNYEFERRFKHLKKGGDTKSVYYLDAYDLISWFPEETKWSFVPGDIIHVPKLPSFVKSRPIDGDNKNSVLMKLVKTRHFIFLNDKTPFGEKKDMAIFRGKVDRKPNRIKFMEMYFGHPMCDLGNISSPKSDLPEKWLTGKMTLWEHLEYKFILALEGNDVASNLKWVMSSNSIAVMPEPTYETWFMEGRLIPDYHYIRIADDFSDLEEKLQYYLENPEEAKKIIRNANEYVSQFFDKKREKLIGLGVVDKYLERTKQKENLV